MESLEEESRTRRDRTHLLSIRPKLVFSLASSVFGTGDEPLEKEGVHLERDLVFEMS